MRQVELGGQVDNDAMGDVLRLRFIHQRSQRGGKFC